jgi:hypothetical protein
MRRIIWLVSTAVLILTATVPALAKGPASATVTGPGIEGPIVLFDLRDHGQAMAEPIDRLLGQTGLWYANHGLERIDPPAELGQPLILTWGEGQHAIQQEIYLHADGGPAIHTLENQPALKGWGGDVTGWFRAQAELEATLQVFGVPTEAAPIASTASSALIFLPVLALAVLLSFRLVNSKLRPVVLDQ